MNKFVQKLLKKLSNTKPPGYTYKLGFARLNSVVDDEVRKAIMEDPAWGSKFPEIDCNGKEAFSLAVKVWPAYNTIAGVSVGMMIIVPEEKKKEDAVAVAEEVEVEIV